MFTNVITSSKPSTLNKASTALFIVCYVATALATLLMSFSISHAEPGEKRLLIAVAAALPFLLVRLVYSIISNLTHIASFNALTPNVTILLCMVLIEEFIVVLIFEGFGLTLQVREKTQHVEAQGYLMADGRTSGSRDSEHQHAGDKAGPQSGAAKAGGVALGIAKKTIIGRLITSLVSGDQQERRPRRSQRA